MTETGSLMLWPNYYWYSEFRLRRGINATTDDLVCGKFLRLPREFFDLTPIDGTPKTYGK